MEFTTADVPGVQCPYCAHSIHPELVANKVTLGRSMANMPRVFNAHCVVLCPRRECYRHFYVTVSGNGVASKVQEAVASATWPPPSTAVDIRIPAEVREDYRQARITLSMGLTRAACLMLRRCVENACREAGAKKHDLIDMIDELKTADRLHPINVISAHKTRLLGNLTAHVYREVPAAELEKAAHLVLRILDDLFVAPALQAELDTAKPPRQ